MNNIQAITNEVGELVIQDSLIEGTARPRHLGQALLNIIFLLCCGSSYAISLT
jgi:hypothetical protein